MLLPPSYLFRRQDPVDQQESPPHVSFEGDEAEEDAHARTLSDPA